MCEECWSLIAKADDDEFLDSLELTDAERTVLEELYRQGEDRITEILELQGQALHDAISELSEDALNDIGELGKVLIALHTTNVFAELFEQAVEDAFEPLFNLAGETELSTLDKKKVWSTSNKAAAQFTKKLKNLIPDMNETSTDVLLHSFSKAIEKGATPSERAQLIKEVSAQAASGEEGPFSTQRSVRIARTMTTAAANGGKQEGWIQSEVVKKKKWRAAGGKRTREDHRKANGQIVNVDEPFTVGGEKLMHPGDPAGSAKQIVNCRCTMQSVLDE